MTKSERALIRAVAETWDDPLQFVRLAWPWGVKGGPLERYDGPDEWQCRFLNAIRDGIRAGTYRRFCVGSGHGVGKSACSSWLIKWFLSTRDKPAVVVTANTGDQLKTKTWRELSKWHQMMIAPLRDAFEWNATTFRLRDRGQLWTATAQTWSLDRAEAFAGTHDDHVLIVTDESSAIPDGIDEVVEGAMTTPGAMRVSFGNRTRASGWFSRAFEGKPLEYVGADGGEKKLAPWFSMNVSGRDARHTDKNWIAEKIAEYGEDSDFVRVRIDGLEPRKGLTNFIPMEYVMSAMSDEAEQAIIVGDHEPMVLGVDVARYGEDATVMFLRHGRKEIATQVVSGEGNKAIAARIVHEFVNRYPLDAINVDGSGGFGSGVVDILQTVYKVDYINEIVGSGESPDPECVNMRANMYMQLKYALARGMCLTRNPELMAELVEFGYHHKNKRQKLQLEEKEDIKKRLGRSPDRADALALTFAVPVLKATMAPSANIYRQDSYI